MSCYLTGSNNVCREFAELTSQQLCDQVFRSLDLVCANLTPVLAGLLFR